MTKKRRTSSHRLNYPVIVLVVVAVIGLVLWFSPRSTPVPIGINEIQNTSGNVELTLNPSSLNLAVGAEQTISLFIDTKSTKVTAVQAELTYDPSLLHPPTISQGSFLTNTLTSPKIENGKISFAYGVTPDSGGKDGSGTLAILKVKPKSTGTATITFVEGTTIVAIDQNGNPINTNVLKSASSSQLNISSAVPAKTPKPSITSSATTQPVANYAITTDPTPTTVTTYTPVQEDTPDTSANYSFTQSELDDMYGDTPKPNFFQKILAYLRNLFGLDSTTVDD